MVGPTLTPDELFRRLRRSLAFDPSWPDGRWPVRWDFKPAGFEIAVGAVLTQNTRWENVEPVLARLSTQSLTTPAAILSADESLERAIRSAGFFRQKAGTLRRLAGLWRQTGGVPPRAALLRVRGIGPETADAICLYASERPEFIADAYSRRLAVRLRLLGVEEATYAHVKAYFESGLERDVALLRAFHALIVQHGKRFCRKNPACRDCPLRPECPSAQ